MNKIIFQIKKNGFYVYKNFLNQEEVEHYLNLINKISKKKIKYKGIPKRDSGDKIIYNLQNKNFDFIKLLTKNKFNQKINDVEIDFSNFKVSKFLMLIKNSYKKSSYFDLYYEKIQKLFSKNHLYLSKINEDLIIDICSMLDIKTKFYKASSMLLSDELKNADLLSEICKKKKCTQYISTYGASLYMGDMRKFPDTNININYFIYENKKYNQIGDQFIPNLSMLDLLFNEGPNSLKIIRDNFKVL
jgi:hypothetical protein